MFTIYANGVMIYNPQADEIQITSAKLVREINASDTFRFTPSTENLISQNLTPLTTYIEVYQNGDTLTGTRVFRGRVMNPETNLYNVVTYDCEGELGFLNDSVVRAYEWGEGMGGVESYLRMLIISHNNQVEADKRFVLRNVTVRENAQTGNIIRSLSSPRNTFDEIQMKLIEPLGGILHLERIGNTTFMDYLADSPSTNTQPIHINHNIIDLSTVQRVDNLATAIVPVGDWVFDTSDPDDLGHRVDITSVNDGVDFIFDPDAVARRGWIVRPVVFDDITLPENLLTRAREVLPNFVNPTESIEVGVFDLSYIDDFYEPIKFLDYVNISSPPNGLEGRLMVTRMVNDFMNPERDILTLGSRFGSFTRTLAQTRLQSVTQDDVRQTVGVINREIVVDIDTTVNNAVDRAVSGVVNDVNDTLFDTTTNINQSVAEQLQAQNTQVQIFLDAETSSLRADIASNYTRLNALTNTTIPNIDTRLNGHETRITNIENIVDDLQGGTGLSDLEDKVDELATDFVNLTGRVATNEGELLSLTGRVDTNEIDITVIKTRLDTLEDEESVDLEPLLDSIEELNDRLDAVDLEVKQIAPILSRLESLENLDLLALITSLENRIEALENA